MHSTLNPKQTDPRDVLLVAPDVVLVAREDKELSNLAHDAMRYPSDPQTHMESDFSAGLPVPPIDTTFCPAAVNDVQVPGDRRSLGRRAVRAFAGFLLAAWWMCAIASTYSMRNLPQIRRILLCSIPPINAPPL
jgi:hypothetical protein